MFQSVGLGVGIGNQCHWQKNTLLLHCSMFFTELRSEEENNTFRKEVGKGKKAGIQKTEKEKAG